MSQYRPKSTLEQWRILQAVVDHGGYAQAGAALNKSQSSLNHAVAKLQQMLGVQLLEVKGRKAYLTAEGEVMLRRSRLLTQSIEELEVLAENINIGWESEIVIATEIIHPKDKLYAALEAFYPQSRGTRIKIVDEVITGTKDRILEHSADLVISAHPPKGYQGDKLEEVLMNCYCGAEHKLARQSSVSLQELEKELQIVISDTSSKPEETVGWLKAEQRWTVTNFHEAIDILSRNTGFCWIPQHYAETALKQKQIVEVALTSAKTKHIFTHLVVPQENTLGPGAKLLKQLILAQYQ